jgi:Tol biopolymer transport system component
VLLKQQYGPRGGIEAPIWLVDVNSGAARRLGDIEAQDAAFAPDGKTILVAKQRELYLTDLQGATPVKLAEAPGKVFWPRWSPDGQRLRFDVWDGVTASGTLWELNHDGTLHQLFIRWKKPSSVCCVCCGEWTADGRFYLFKGQSGPTHSGNSGPLRQYWSVNDRLGSDNSEPAALTTLGSGVGSAAPSPLGNTIYVSVEQGGRQDTFKWDLKPNHAPSPLYPELKADVLEFSRDGQWIAYSHRVPAGYELWRARADGTEKLQLTTPFQGIFMVKYSPDSRKIAFMAFQPSGPWKIYWVSAEGGALHEIPSPISVQADPAWSGDGQAITFGQPPEEMGGGAPSVVRHLYRYDLRTEKTTEVPGSTGLFSPRSSPDGRYLSAILADWHGMSLLDTTTSEWRPLMRQRWNGLPFWSPDSAWVYFNDIGDPVLWRVHVPDGRLEELGPIPLPSGYNECSAVAAAPDNAAVVWCWDSRSDIFALDYKEQK